MPYQLTPDVELLAALAADIRARILTGVQASERRGDLTPIVDADWSRIEQAVNDLIETIRPIVSAHVSKED